MKKFDDIDLATVIAKALRTGVISAFACMLTGGIAYLIKHGNDQSRFTTFTLTRIKISDIFSGLSFLDSRSIVYAGLILLIATPVMRILLSVFSFVLEKDYFYTAVTLLVLLIIFFSIISGHAA
ncbi:Uncharacterized membrane protein [Chitinophaga sp. YR627]|uniref:DUF1634 domain-containing protein n=1 Tax=Chitinophaga sp. YR627 TaxID=1881041 RepID=UPI0008E40807|nr:DUF1634 domain-containing protein [Chitinophaga sp. YR627]SFM89545.1 Uncharacterized membrane protein [Chitinophaga sp. YR627]